MCSLLEIVLVCHGQGEHSLQPPASLEVVHPALTALGRTQAAALRERLQPTPRDAIVAGPTLRALQTAAIATEGTGAVVFVSPYLGPRTFPFPEDDAEVCAITSLSDYILSAKSVKKQFPAFRVLHDHYRGITNEGVGRMDRERFRGSVERLVAWAVGLRRARLLAFSHGGTIAHYRELLAGTPPRPALPEDGTYIAFAVDR